MEISNPLGRMPETNETIANAGCHCVCNVQLNNHDATGVAAWLPFVPDCQCSCVGADNSASNNSKAYNAAQ